MECAALLGGSGANTHTADGELMGEVTGLTGASLNDMRSQVERLGAAGLNKWDKKAGAVTLCAPVVPVHALLTPRSSLLRLILHPYTLASVHLPTHSHEYLYALRTPHPPSGPDIVYPHTLAASSSLA
jgi:hypothetical protein